MRSSFLFASFLAVVPVRFLVLNPHIYILIKKFSDYICEPHPSSSCSAGSPYYFQKRFCDFSDWNQLCIPRLLRVSINTCFFIWKRTCDLTDICDCVSETVIRRPQGFYLTQRIPPKFSLSESVAAWMRVRLIVSNSEA